MQLGQRGSVWDVPLHRPPPKAALPVMRLGQRGLFGMYRFTDPHTEWQFQARMVQWCFWPAVCHLWTVVALDALGMVSYIGINVYDIPWYVGWVGGMDLVALALLAALHGAKAARRYVVPLICVFLWLEMVEHAAFIRLHTDTWTDNSYSLIVPAGASVYVDGPGAATDVSARLRGHFGILAAYRAQQSAFVNTILPCVITMMLGLNRWSVITLLWLPTAFVIGLAATPQVTTASLFLTGSIAYTAALLCGIFAAVLERMQRRNFETERLLQWELQASQMADSVLNHSLKNMLADVAGSIEMVLAGALQSRALEECIVTLRRGLRSCKERHVYLQLAAGRYQPVLNAVHLPDFGRQLLAGRNVTGHFPDCTVYADHMLLTLIFDNALSNALKHGDPQNPDVRFSIEEIPAEICDGLPEGKRRFCFQVTNIAHPGRPELTPERVEQLFAGRAEAPRPHAQSVVPTLSDRIGLSHCVLAAKLGGIALSLGQEDDLVVFAGRIDVEVQEASGGLNTGSPQATDPLAPNEPVAAFPAGLRFVILDDSLCAQRLLRFHIEQRCAPATVTCLGASAADVDAFMAHALMADVVIVDQNLDWQRDSYLGSDLVRQLRRLQHAGFICIRSAEDSPSDQQLYAQAGANCCLGKDLLGPAMVRQLQSAYQDFLRHTQKAASCSELTPPRPIILPAGVVPVATAAPPPEASHQQPPRPPSCTSSSSSPRQIVPVTGPTIPSPAPLGSTVSVLELLH